MDWHHQSSPQKKVLISAGKVMAELFRVSEGNLLVEFLEQGAKINSELYVQILKKLKQPILKFLPKEKDEYSSSCMTTPDRKQFCERRESIETLGWISLLHPLYIPVLAPTYNFATP